MTDQDIKEFAVIAYKIPGWPKLLGSLSMNERELRMKLKSVHERTPATLQLTVIEGELVKQEQVR